MDKRARLERYDAIHARYDEARPLSGGLFAENKRLLNFLIPEGASVLDVGCGQGTMLATLRVSRGVGIDASKAAIEKARNRHPELDFLLADAEEEIPTDETFDTILLNFAIGDFLDVWKVLRNLRKHCRDDTKIIVVYYNFLWDPVITLASWLGIRRPWLNQNWLSQQDIKNLFHLNGFELIHDGTRTLCPLAVPLIAPLCNCFLAKLPLVQHLNLITYCVGRLIPGELERGLNPKSVSIIIPTRNEKGNIRDAVERTPTLGSGTELIFVDGASTDGTIEEIESQIELHKGGRRISLIHQTPRSDETAGEKMLRLGKGDAVRKGFAAASGEILVILDSDLTVPPEDMEKFYLALAEGRAEFVNGNRLSYPMEKEAMRFLNLVANRWFGIVFTWLLGQRVKDTLCGTKALSRESWRRINEHRADFGEFDPFGDFDLLFGAAKQNLKIIDLPVRYCARTYGNVKIERFRHGWLLLKMCWIAFRRFKLQ